MFWKYILFEGKLALGNRKNWLISLFFLAIFMLLFMYASLEEPQTLQEQKKEEADDMKETLKFMDDVREDDPEAAEVYDVLTEASSIINFQRYYIGSGFDPDEFIKDGLELNELRLQVHEMGNIGIPEHLIIPKKEILQEDAMLKYLQANDLLLESDSFITGHYITESFTSMSGVVFFLIVLIAGSEMLVYENRYKTIYNGLPIPFMKKAWSKVVIQFIYITLFLTTGLYIGLYYLSKKLESMDLDFPIMIYVNENYQAISAVRYMLYMMAAFLLISLLILGGAILGNMLFKNAFATILAGIGIFIIPYLLAMAEWKVPVLSTLSYLDFANVLAGDASSELHYASLDYVHGFIWLALANVVMYVVIYGLNRWTYYRIYKRINQTTLVVTKG